MGLGVREVGGSVRRSAGHLLTCSGLDAHDQSRGDAGCGDNTVGLPEVRRLHAWHRLPPARDATSIVPPKVAEPQSTSPVSTASAIIIIRRLVRRAWSIYRWDTRPARSP